MLMLLMLLLLMLLMLLMLLVLLLVLLLMLLVLMLMLMLTLPSSFLSLKRYAMSNPPIRKPAEIELRFKIEQDPLTYLAMGNGHSIGHNAPATDIVRASVYTCCYLWMLAHPDFRPTTDMRETCLEYAQWLLEPDALALLTAGARTADTFDLDSPRLADFERSFLRSLPLAAREPMKLQAKLSKGLWTAIKAAYGFRHGATDDGIQRLLLACLRHAQAVALEAKSEDNT
jgi:hypothetical protein